MSVVVTDSSRLAKAKRDVIILFASLALTPLAFWFGVTNVQNFWLAVAPLTFAACSIFPLMCSYAIWSEYRDALKGIQRD